MKQERGDRVWRGIAAALVLIVLVATLRPGAPATGSWLRGCLLCGPYGLADVVRNFILFIPLGLALPRAMPSERRALLVIVLLTLGIELAQLAIPGRDSNPSDALFNTLGGVTGLGLARTLSAWWTPGISWGRKAVVAYVLTTLALVGGLGFATRPVLPQGAPIGQWAPIRAGFAPFTGLMHSVEIDGRAVPAWAIPEGRELLTAFLYGREVRMRFTRGTYPAEPQLLLRIVMPGHRELLAIAIQGDGLVVRPRTRLTRFRLFEPMTTVPGVLAGSTTGDLVDVSVYRSDDRYCVRTAAAQAAACEPAVTAGRGWSAVVNTDGWTIPRRIAMIVVVVGVVGFPLGWWGGAGVGFLGVVGIAVGVWAISGATSLPFSTWELFPLAAGALAGVTGRRGWTKALRFMNAGTDLESAKAMSPSETR